MLGRGESLIEGREGLTTLCVKGWNVGKGGESLIGGGEAEQHCVRGWNVVDGGGGGGQGGCSVEERLNTPGGGAALNMVCRGWEG
jgi:hypothetical protein